MTGLPRGLRRYAARGPLLLLLALAPGCRAGRARDIDSGPAAMAAAVRTRPFEARHSVRVAHRPFDPSRAPNLSDLPASALEAIQRTLQKSKDGARESASERAAIELWTGQYEAALATVLDALQRAPDDAALLTDLSAIYLRMGERERPLLRTTARALDAATRAAALAPTAPEPAFNQALALSALGLHHAARDAWQRAIALDADPDWRREAEERLDALRDSERDEWPQRRAVLVGTGPLDDAWLHQTADGWPQEMREALEEVLLPEWGRALVAGDTGRAHDWLDRARRAAAQLGRGTGDALLVDAIAAIDRAPAVTRADLAAGHASYGGGTDDYERTRREEAMAAFEKARRLLERGSSPFALRARMQVGVLLYQLSRFPEAEARFTQVATAADRSKYRVLHARAEWLRGLALSQQAHIEDAVAAYRRARAEFAEADEAENVASISGTAADTLRRIGEHSEGWVFLSDALARLHRVRAPRRQLTLLLNGSLYASDDRLLRAALLFQDASLTAARERGAATTIIEGLTRRARLRLQAGDAEAARRDLAEAAGLLPSVASPSLHEYVGAWLQLASAELAARRDAAAAVPMFTVARRAFLRAEPDEVPRLSVGLARASLDAGQPERANAELMEGLRVFESRWQHLSRDQYRVSYLDDGWDLYAALMRLYAVDFGDELRAFELAERGRARTLAQGTRSGEPVTLKEIRGRLPAGATLLYYAVLEDRLLVWVVTRERARLTLRPVSRTALEAQVAAYRQELANDGLSEQAQGTSRALYQELVPEDAGDASAGPLIVVADGVLNTVPFATLVDPRTERPLIETRPLAMAPSATHMLAGVSAAAGTDTPRRCLLVGGRETGPAAARLGPLPNAAAELRDVAAVYARPTVLEDEAATVDALRAALRGQEVLHFAAHAVANESFPWRSQLLLAPGRHNPDGAVTLDELRRLNFSGVRLVVLSACRSASGPIAHGEGVISLMRPFLEQRVPAVVGTLWDVDDAASRVLLSRFHAAYVGTQDPARALQQAQLSLLSSKDPKLSDPRAWGAFVVTSVLR